MTLPSFLDLEKISIKNDNLYKQIQSIRNFEGFNKFPYSFEASILLKLFA